MIKRIVSPISSRHLSRAALPLALLAAAVLSACQGGHAQSSQTPPPPAVSAAMVIEQTVPQWDSYSGRIEAVEQVQLRPRVAGHIDRVHVSEGELVAKGDVLFSLDPRPYQLQLDRALAELAAARSQALLAQDQAERAQRLLAQQAIADDVARQRVAAAQQAQATQRAAQAAVDAARLDLQFTQVRSPIAGRAGRALVTAGNLVSAGQQASLLTTVVSQQLHVHFDVDQTALLRYRQQAVDAGSAAAPQPLAVEVGLGGQGEHPYRGRIDFTDNQLERSTGTIAMRALLDNHDGQLLPGLYARVRLQAGPPAPVLLINERAVITDQDRKFVYVVDADNTAQRRDIVLGARTDGMRQVRMGLGGGERVIVEGVQKVFMPGMPVTVTPVPMQADTPAAPAIAAR